MPSYNQPNGGQGDAGHGGLGGNLDIGVNGFPGTEWDATHGSGGGSGSYNGVPGVGGLYGGGGCHATASNGGAGRQGIIVITYTPVVSGSSKFFQLF